jgi:hypothetical protein
VFTSIFLRLLSDMRINAKSKLRHLYVFYLICIRIRCALEENAKMTRGRTAGGRHDQGIKSCTPSE